MKDIAPGVFWLDGLLGGNVYAVAVDGGVVLIDSGMPGAVRGIPAQLDDAGYAVGDLRAIILTHAHIDHLGGAARLVKWSGAPSLSFIVRTCPMQREPYRCPIIPGSSA